MLSPEEVVLGASQELYTLHGQHMGLMGRASWPPRLRDLNTFEQPAAVSFLTAGTTVNDTIPLPSIQQAEQTHWLWKPYINHVSNLEVANLIVVKIKIIISGLRIII